MGMFMASVAFRPGKNWEAVKPEIEKLHQDVSGLVTNLDQACTGYAIVSPYGDQAAFLDGLALPISRITGDYAVMAICNDSDFNIMELYHNGIRIERSCIGECYEEFYELEPLGAPDPENWKPLLLDPNQEDALQEALFEEEVFAEDNLRMLSAVTGLPIFDDALVFGE